MRNLAGSEELGLGDALRADLAALPDECQERIREAVKRLIATYAEMTGTALPSARTAIVLPFSRN